jgi:hypothetical protein
MGLEGLGAGLRVEGLGAGLRVEGLGGGLVRAARRAAEPATVAVRVPAWSQLGERGKIPSSGRRP